MRVSIVIPLHNEAPNVDLVYHELREFAGEDHRIAEIIFVDDGSTDGTYERILRACADDMRVTAIRLRRNFGQTAALSAGFDTATGEVICPMDGDLQNDPRDIPLLLEKINLGYDVVSGWRKERKDTWLTRRVPSWFANRLISKITNVRLHDYGCALKAYRREVLLGTVAKSSRCGCHRNGAEPGAVADGDVCIVEDDAVRHPEPSATPRLGQCEVNARGHRIGQTVERERRQM